MSKILVIGNGFDLAHGLPTKYTDFLNFSELFIADEAEYKLKIKKMNQQEKKKKERLLFYVRICRKLSRNFDDKFKRNSLIKYFLRQYNRKENWVDFEGLLEIYISNINKYFDTNKSEDLNLLPKDIKYLINKNYYKEISDIKEIVYDYLRKNLDELIDCLEFYFKEVVNNSTVFKYPMEFYPSENHRYGIFTYIISFNYTDTYNKICEKLHFSGIDNNYIHYIHGNVRCGNMVLGISDSDSENLDTVYFKKYFQRIQKHTGNKYKRWISQNNEVAFMGHSMDITDGDIIKELITNTLKTTIYYYNQSDYEQKVINLIKIFGKDEFETLYYERKIVFKVLSVSALLQDNKIVVDKMRL